MTGEGISFSPDFIWGVATASYQIEGGWDQDGKGVSIWDAFTHERSRMKDTGVTGDVACDSFHLYAEDVKMIKDLGVSHYRFSISWSRVIPDPLTGEVNMKGIEYYNRLINALLEVGVQPTVTLYHWDMPQILEEKFGGWASESIIEYFVKYAEVCFHHFGDRVKTWITINEPKVFTSLGYGHGCHAPGRTDFAEVGPYVLCHNALKAHGRTYDLYDKKFRPSQNGIIGISLSSDWSEPLDPSNSEDVEANTRYFDINIRLFAHPVFVNGDYPDTLKKVVQRNSDKAGSRLPEFTDEERLLIKGSSDFFGLNYYTSRYVTHKATNGEGFARDKSYEAVTDPSWKRGESEWLYSVPWGLLKLLVWIREEYGNPVIYITENGFSDKPGTIHDTARIEYIREHLTAVAQAITEDKCRVQGYYCWSLMDNFEWDIGYKEAFGLHAVDFSDPKRSRSPKDSALCYKEIIKSNKI